VQQSRLELLHIAADKEQMSALNNATGKNDSLSTQCRPVFGLDPGASVAAQSTLRTRRLAPITLDLLAPAQ
jgi:hypothetical protein